MVLITEEINMKFSVSSVLLQLLPWGTLGDFGGSHFFSRALASRSLMPCKVPLVGKECMFFSSFSTQTLSSFWTSLATMIGVSCAWSWFVIPNRIWHQSLSMGIQHRNNCRFHARFLLALVSSRSTSRQESSADSEELAVSPFLFTSPFPNVSSFLLLSFRLDRETPL